MKLLIAGDLHMGRASTRLPDEFGRDVTSTTRAWGRLVDAAINEQVDALCLTGDIADQDNRFYEAIGPLETGIQRLADHRIRTVAVAGNHDHDVLPRLADNLSDKLSRDDFTLLGRGGAWQRLSLPDTDHPALHIDGWSFPQRYVDRSPLHDYNLPPTDDAPTLAMLHGDLDAPASRYAPLDSAQMRSMRADAWLLGHVHLPALHHDPNAPLILYPGSLQAMDPGETGAHGAWLIEVDRHTVRPPRFTPLSAVRYESIDVDVTGVEDDAALQSTVLETVREQSGELVEASGESLRCLALRLHLTGNTPLAAQLDALTRNLRDDLTLPVGEARVLVERVTTDALPPIDLHEHAQGNTPPAALARLLLALDETSPDETTRRLIGEAQRRLADQRRRPDFAALFDDPAAREASEADARQYLRKQATKLLNALLSTVEK